ncbi:MAG: hypothetical protein SAK29_29895 [Scytonema sp. PMC 1069.18]|nr:hypothetical protein [Scytonema sp. PMC 1069.18]MEC4883565.1 hypothetical protein [Scytonema sp. PMC 1070.18]
MVKVNVLVRVRTTFGLLVKVNVEVNDRVLVKVKVVVQERSE